MISKKEWIEELNEHYLKFPLHITKKERIKDWIVAMRSGEYVKGHDILFKRQNNQNCYCAVGVLCKAVHDIPDQYLLGQYSELGALRSVERGGQHLLTLPLAYMVAELNDGKITGYNSFERICLFLENNIKYYE